MVMRQASFGQTGSIEREASSIKTNPEADTEEDPAEAYKPTVYFSRDGRMLRV